MKLKHYSGFRAYGTEELIMGIIDVDHRDYCKGPLLHSPLTTFVLDQDASFPGVKLGFGMVSPRCNKTARRRYQVLMYVVRLTPSKVGECYSHGGLVGLLSMTSNPDHKPHEPCY